MQIANHIPGQGLRTERKPSNSTARKLTAQWEKAKVCRCLSKDTQTLSKHRERRSAPLVIGDIQVRCHTARMAPCKNPGSRCRRVSPWGGGNGRPCREQSGGVLSCTVNTPHQRSASPTARTRKLPALHGGGCDSVQKRAARDQRSVRRRHGPGSGAHGRRSPQGRPREARSVGDGARKLHC